MCTNDIVVHGAEPLFFLDYLAVGKLIPSVAKEIIKGIANGCTEGGCALIGGETAEMPNMYRAGEYDLAGFCVGVVDLDNLIDGSSISVGDALIGIASSGLHSNGYSLVRKLFFQRLKWKIDLGIPDLGHTLGEELLIPTRIYVRTVLNLLKDFRIKGLAHITGGGITENVCRILPDGCQALIQKTRWTPPFIFQLISQKGKLSENEMFRVFNNGIGMVVVIAKEQIDECLQRLQGLRETAYHIGEIARRKPGSSPVLYV
jgi:phosphoribosylformylglycinamidine cyclo-ligase